MNRIPDALSNTTFGAPADPTNLDLDSTAVDLQAVARALKENEARNASGLRWPADPMTGDRDYSIAELELMTAMHDYKKSSGRMFPTWSEVLEVLKGLGYQKMV